MLLEVAERLRAVLDETDPAGPQGLIGGQAHSLARIGGDEFAVLLGEQDPAELNRQAGRILGGIGQVRAPGQISGGQRASIGIASGPRWSPDDLLRNADLAMYRAKAAGGGVATTFEPWMRERMLERSRMRGRLETAIRAGGLGLAMQPVVDLGTAQWRGFEALVRWPDGAVVRPPDEFLPIAEETGLIVPLGEWVLRNALQVLAAWDVARPPPGPGSELSVAVNVSPRQLEDDDFADQVLAALVAQEIDPARLTLEITEQTAVQDFGSTASQLSPLRASGIHVAIDDFGTGYSSLRYLTRLPVDALKIDKQFVDGLGIRSEDEVLVTSMLRLAADLGLDVVAEGVETTLQADLLRSHGCQLAQGYLFSRPVPSDQLEAVAAARDLPRQRGPQEAAAEPVTAQTAAGPSR